MCLNTLNLNCIDITFFPKSQFIDFLPLWLFAVSFLGPIIEFDPISETPNSLADTIKVPYGCGEQNMMVCGPNVFAFKYLKDEGNDRPNTVSQIKKYIIDGNSSLIFHFIHTLP